MTTLPHAAVRCLLKRASDVQTSDMIFVGVYEAPLRRVVVCDGEWYSVTRVCEIKSSRLKFVLVNERGGKFVLCDSDEQVLCYDHRATIASVTEDDDEMKAESARVVD